MRVYCNEQGHLFLKPGDYGKDKDGMWFVRPPKGHGGFLNPELHKVNEHEDGTITVSPSIVGDQYHGFLEKGIWREA